MSNTRGDKKCSRKNSSFFYSPFLYPFVIISSCQAEESISVIEEPVPTQERETSANGIVFKLKDTEFATSPTSISTTIENTTNHTCSYGEFFRVEYNQDGLWYTVNYPDNIFEKFPAFIDMGFTLQPNDTVTQVFSLKRYNLNLPRGQYRLAKTVICPSPQGNEITLAVPFEIGM